MRLLGVIILVSLILGPWIIRQLKKVTWHSPQVHGRLIWAVIAGLITTLFLFFGIPDFVWFWKLALGVLVGLLVYRGISRTPQPAASSSTISTPWITGWEVVGLVLVVLIGISVYNTWFSDQLIDQKEVAPGETWTTRYVDGSFYTKGVEGREYLVKFTGCTDFLRFKTLENGATVAIPPCAKPGAFEIRLVPGDTLPLMVSIYKDRGFRR